MAFCKRPRRCCRRRQDLRRLIYTIMTKCVMCFTEHNNLWNGEHNMYCAVCEPLRETARNCRSHVLGNLYLADMPTAAKFDGMRLCVHENTPTYVGQGNYIHIPILAERPKSKHDRTGAVVSIDRLEFAVDFIEWCMQRHEPLLVHCVGGIERSPLTVAWWLTKTRRIDTIDAAYSYLKKVRPAVSPRLFWLPSNHELYKPIG